ncbi:MAG: aromatic acid exporter family protein [Bacillus sp. (in: firmicutes)]
MFKIGYRTVKTAIGVTLAISIAQLLQLNSFPSAGIITILCIQVTKKQSLRAAFSRFFACLIAMVYSFVFFEGIAFHPVVIGLMLLVFIPTTVIAGVKDGVVTSSVIILHIYSAGHVTVALVLNELCLIVVGVVVALLMNLYMPSLEKQFQQYQEEIESDFAFIFKKMAQYIRTRESNWDGTELLRVTDHISQAKLLAFRNVENHVRRNDDVYYTYFKMREKQFEVIERMLPLVASLPKTSEYHEMIANFMEDLANHIHPYNTSHIYLRKLEEMEAELQQMALPKSREEFNGQAAIIDLVKELEKYIILKSVYKGLPREKKGMKKELATETK